MARSLTKTVRVPCPIWDALVAMRQPGGPLDEYPSDNAMLTGILLYTVLFPKRHELTMELARLSTGEQDVLHDYAHHCRTNGKDLAEGLPKPATAAALVSRAKEWRRNSGAVQTQTGRP